MPDSANLVLTLKITYQILLETFCLSNISGTFRRARTANIICLNCAKPLKYVNQDPLSNVRICPIPRYFRDIMNSNSNNTMGGRSLVLSWD
jgi:hypothetical protein